MLDLSRARDRMVDIQIARRGVRDRRVLDAMRRVPREAFVEPGFEEFAYEDGPLPIGEGQTISQPYIVALMIEAAEVKPGDSVLEVGAGSGYAAAVMSHIADRVYAIERHPTLGEAARRRFGKLGYDNIDLRVGDGTKGWPEAAPFNAILVAAGGPEVPPALKEQLAIGGRLVIPVGEEERWQTLLKITRTGEADYDEEDLGTVAFVPLIGEQGWAEDGRRSATNHVPGRRPPRPKRSRYNEEATMPDKKNAPKRPKDAETEPQKAQQEPVDDTVDDSFPASDPPAWTTTGAKSVAARRESENEDAPALDDVRTANEATAAAERRSADAKAAAAERPSKTDQSSDSPKRQGDKLSHAVRTAAEVPEVEDEP